MSLKMTQRLKRIVIIGKTMSDVQGVNLRETIEELAKKLDIKGQVRNIKNEPKVEIICEADKADELYAGLSDLKEKDNRVKIDNITEPTDELFDEFKDFNVVREDELTEMVWGLQGAGKVFDFAEKRREERRKTNLFNGLKSELNAISNHAQLISEGNKKTEFRPFTVEHFLKEPPVNDEDLIQNLRDLHDLCRETNTVLNNDEKEKRTEDLRNILDLTKQISEKLKKKSI